MNADATLARLLDTLWAQYKSRVSYAARYAELVTQKGGRVINDHIALRTFNCKTGDQPAGVEAMARVFTALGYQRKDQYVFEDKHLTAWHYEHQSNTENPKIFISQLEVDHLSAPVAQMIRAAVTTAPDLYDPADPAKLFTRPWAPPPRAIIEPVNKESQYAAWTLLHGNSVNHFTAYINHQEVADWPDLEATVTALRADGLPMKAELEGERGSKLRQSSTQAVDELCEVTEADGTIGKIKWSYAYYELAERGMVPGPNGKPVRFQAFLGAQATNLFEMTKRA